MCTEPMSDELKMFFQKMCVRSFAQLMRSYEFTSPQPLLQEIAEKVDTEPYQEFHKRTGMLNIAISVSWWYDQCCNVNFEQWCKETYPDISKRMINSKRNMAAYTSAGGKGVTPVLHTFFPKSKQYQLEAILIPSYMSDHEEFAKWASPHIDEIINGLNKQAIPVDASRLMALIRSARMIYRRFETEDNRLTEFLGKICGTYLKGMENAVDQNVCLIEPEHHRILENFNTAMERMTEKILDLRGSFDGSHADYIDRIHRIQDVRKNKLVNYKLMSLHPTLFDARLSLMLSEDLIKGADK